MSRTESMEPDVAPKALPHPFADLLGFAVERRGEGTSLLTLEVRPEHRNPYGLVHGAVLYALADTGMGAALSSLLAPGEICPTLEIKINYLRPWQSGTVSCESRVIFKGRGTAVLQSDLHDGAGRHLAQASGTFAIITRSVG